MMAHVHHWKLGTPAPETTITLGDCSCGAVREFDSTKLMRTGVGVLHLHSNRRCPLCGRALNSNIHKMLCAGSKAIRNA